MKFKMRNYFIVFILILAIPMLATYRRHTDILDGTLGVGTSTTATNGTDFTSANIKIHDVPFIGITAIFTRAAGSASLVTFLLEVSYDGGTTWATFKGTDITIATNTAAVTGNIVRCFYEVQVWGASNIRLKSIQNADGANAISAVNVVVSR